MPLLKYTYSGLHTTGQLFSMIKKINKNISVIKISKTYEKAQKLFRESLNNLKITSQEEIKNNPKISVILLGRPYTVLSSSMNKHIPDIFSKAGVNTYFQDSLPFSQDIENSAEELLDSYHWKYAARIIESASYCAQTPGLYPVLITSFKCAPDSFVVDSFKSICEAHGKPYCILQLDDHDSNVGYETRIEAALRSFNNHQAIPNKETERAITIKGPQILSAGTPLKDKTVLLPNWDTSTCKLVVANLQGAGMDAHLLPETEETILKSMKHNSGQCIPLNAIAQGCIEYINMKKLNPANTVLWNINSAIACNIKLYPYFTHEIFKSYGKGMEKVSMYLGEATFIDQPVSVIINTYLAYMFGGMFRKLGCRLRPYELEKGETNKVIQSSLDKLETAFRDNKPKEPIIKEAVEQLLSKKYCFTERPKVALFGDLYTRDNTIMNQDIISTIEDNGGEVITTPYNEYLKIIMDPYIKKWIRHGYFKDVAWVKLLEGPVRYIEKKYLKYFNQILGVEKTNTNKSKEKYLEKLDVRVEHTGESLDNILKIFSLIEHYDDIALFVQLNPAFCCPSLITEAMGERIEELTGTPVITIEYDGTKSDKNDKLIPYLHFCKNDKNECEEEAI